MFPLFLSQLALVAAIISPSYGRLYTSPSQLTETTYDYIVVGAGTAGNVVAARLTENPKISVLVLEAGVSDAGVTASIVPLLGPSLTPNTIYDWNYTTTAQAGYNGRKVPYARGKMLGGSSSVNYMVYMRGSSDDFDRYANVTGDRGWNWNNMQQYIKKNEKFVAPADGHNITGQYNPAVHSFNGAVSVSLPGFPTPLDDRVIATTEELSSEFPFNLDISGGNVLGIGWSLATIGGGKRSSSATAYLTPALTPTRPNLDVLINAQVTKLVRTGTVNGVPSFRGVKFSEKAGAASHTVYARKEVVLSAGVFGSPVILQLSGIGDKTDLRSAGIDTVVNNPSVGRNMSDHALVSNVFSVASNQTFDDLFRDPSLFNASLAQWFENQTGPFAGGVCNHLGFFRLPSKSSIFEKVRDPSAGSRSSHWQIIFSNLWVVPGVASPATGNFLSITTTLISPTSRGDVKISSSNPFDKPLINPNFLTTAFDIFTMREAVKAVRRFVSADAWKGFVIGPFGDLAQAITDAQIESYIRNTAATIFHATGTASMSPKNAKWGVVDPDLKVKGIDGVRIVDGSILPYSPNAHAQGPIYLVGERGADLIKGDYA